MKVSISVLLSLLASVAVARPHVMDDEGDPLPQTSRVTAFVIDEKGNPSIECWEISGMTPYHQSKRVSGSKGAVRGMTLATGRELDGVDILTWPAISPIWPDPSLLADAEHTNDVHARWFDLSDVGSLFAVQKGLIQVTLGALGLKNQDDDDDEDWTTSIYSMENGDDWFYFEDNYSSGDDGYARRKLAENPPFTVNAVSGSETEVIRLRFPQGPAHKVLHKGPCGFTGISVPAEEESHRRSSRVHNSFRVQRNDL